MSNVRLWRFHRFRTDLACRTWTGWSAFGTRQHRLRVKGVADGAPSNAASVALNITTVSPTGDGGYLTVWACDAAQPDASNINYANGQTIPNLVLTPISASGEVCIYVFRATHLLADINGHFRPQ